MAQEHPIAELYQTLKKCTPAVQRDRRLTAPDVDSVKVHSALCGSQLTLDAVIRDQHVCDLGYRVRACSLGQATTAIVAARASGLTALEVRRVMGQLEALLAGTGTQCDWPELEAFALAKDVPSRHGSALLPFRALDRLFTRAMDRPDDATGTEAAKPI